jgi:hypothetical protein
MARKGKTQIPGATAQVEQALTWSQRQPTHRATPPPTVDAKREHPIQQIVLRGNLTKHGLNFLAGWS